MELTKQEVHSRIEANMQKCLEQLGWMSKRVVMPRFRYWRRKGDNYAFCWTTEPDSEGKFHAFIYRICREKWKLSRDVVYGKRYKAKRRALKWYNARVEKMEEA